MSAYRVGIDAHYLSKNEGNRSYVRSLLEGLRAIGVPSGLELLVYSHDPQRVEAELGAFLHRSLPHSAWLRTALAAPLAQRRDRLELWHGSWVVAPWTRCPLVLTVHDVLFASHPQLFGAAQGRRLRFTVEAAVRRAERVLTPTQATRHALLSAYPWIDPRRVLLVPLGIDLSRFSATPAPDDEPRRTALGVVGPYALAVGRPHPRKNLDMLFAAVAHVEGLQLVVAGPLRGRQEDLRRKAEQAGLGTRLVLVSDPPDVSLAALYRGSSAFCFPSLAEGFGLPALEALACGAPVLISEDPALLEVCADAACALPPGDVSGWAAALRELLEQGPGRAAETGPERARSFDQRTMARATLDVYRDVLGM